jgi:FkbM family methyltransferase
MGLGEETNGMGLIHKLQKILWGCGIDISRFAPESHPFARKKQLLNYYKIDTVLDVGANSGHFALKLKEGIGYANRVVSFEPLSSAFELLQANAMRYPNWEVLNIALGDTEEMQEINISGNSASSSLLDMLPSHLNSDPESRYIGTELIETKTLDSIFENLCDPTENIYLKIDTQGYESNVLKGAELSLKHIDIVQMEMALVPLYKGEGLFEQMCMLMGEKGYRLIALDTGFSDPVSGHLLQVDGIFHRSSK